jgi:hypothetical protein
LMPITIFFWADPIGFFKDAGKVSGIFVSYLGRDGLNVEIGVLQKQQCLVHPNFFEIFISGCPVDLAKGHLKAGSAHRGDFCEFRNGGVGG